MVCRSCGAIVGDSDRFCNTCGARLAAAPEAKLPPPSAGAEPVRSAPPVTASNSSPDADDQDRTTEMPAPVLYDLADETDPDVTSQLAAMATGRAASVTPASTPSVGGADTAGPAAPTSATTTIGTQPPVDTGQVPASYAPYSAAAHTYGDDDRDREPAAGAHRFRFRLMLVAAILAAGAGACAAVTDVIEIETDTTFPLFGTWMVNDFGTNLTVAMAVAGGVMVVGALLGCFGFRWGGGLAGGAGLAIAGWAALVVGLAEVPLAQADLAVQAGILDQVRLTRDVGYWLVAGAGVLGVVVAATSLTSIRRDRATNLNPWVAALGAAASLVAAAGPLLPVNDASLDSNWSSAGGSFDQLLGGPVDLPTAFFAGRLVQLGLVAIAGLVGFLLVRRYGLGLAAGGFVVCAWLAATAALEQTDAPIGPALANPGADDTIPHAVTIGGLAVAVFCLLMAAIEVALSRRPD